MFIVKVRDRATPATLTLMPEHAYRIFMQNANKWKTCLFHYASYAAALSFVEKQAAMPDRFATHRDYRIFEQNGRKLTLRYTYTR